MLRTHLLGQFGDVEESPWGAAQGEQRGARLAVAATEAVAADLVVAAVAVAVAEGAKVVA